MLGTMLRAPTASHTSSSSSSSGVSDDFVQSVTAGNLAVVRDLTKGAAAVPARDYWWLTGARELHSMVPELRQLCNWGMCVGENSTASSCAPSTPAEAAGPCVGPEDFMPKIDLVEDNDTPPPLTSTSSTTTTLPLRMTQ